MIEVAVGKPCILGEGPVWDSKTKRLLYVDIINGTVHEYDPATGDCKTIDVHQMVGAIAICNDGNLLAALKEGLAIINRRTGKLDLFSFPESHLPANRFNDGKCDPSGRFWIGSMHVDETANAGTVYMLETNLSVSKKIENTTISNGMAWSPDQQIFYYIDTPTMNVVAYDFDNASGTIKNKRAVISVKEKDGHPDGMTVDTDGMLWIAHWNGWQVARWNPNTGEKLFSLSMPVANVTSCTFGGDGLTDLYITTAKKGLTDEESKNQPLAGNLFVWKNSGYRGIAAFEYKSRNTADQ